MSFTFILLFFCDLCDDDDTEGDEEEEEVVWASRICGCSSYENVVFDLPNTLSLSSLSLDLLRIPMV